MSQRRRRPTAFGMTMLDLISCALGASTILAIISSDIREPASSIAPSDFIIIELAWSGPEALGLRLTSPDKESIVVSWYSSEQEPTTAALGVNVLRTRRSEPNGCVVLTVTVIGPKVGTWEAAPFVSALEFPGKQRSEASLKVFHRVWTSRKAPMNPKPLICNDGEKPDQLGVEAGTLQDIEDIDV
jgi:hypothetical protein